MHYDFEADSLFYFFFLLVGRNNFRVLSAFERMKNLLVVNYEFCFNIQVLYNDFPDLHLFTTPCKRKQWNCERGTVFIIFKAHICVLIVQFSELCV